MLVISIARYIEIKMKIFLKVEKSLSLILFDFCMSFYHYSNYKLLNEKKLKLGTFDIRKS